MNTTKPGEYQINAEWIKKFDDIQPITRGLGKENDCAMPTAFDRFRLRSDTA